MIITKYIFSVITLMICSLFLKAEYNLPVKIELDKTDVASIKIIDINDPVLHTAKELVENDMKKCGLEVTTSDDSDSSNFSIIIGKNNDKSLIDFINKYGINLIDIGNKWENYIIYPFIESKKNNKKGLLILGSDSRGAAYGLLHISELLGISPWYWWADVPNQSKLPIQFDLAKPIQSGPKVKYRGIFINDEAPALSSWAHEKFGGFNHKFYEKVFELMLRLKANYIWPAMWGNSFYEDDQLNKLSAIKYGIVIGTSHHEPLMRAHVDWKKNNKGGEWNYEKNEKTLKQFWSEGVKRADNEKIITVGMRGDGDEPMSEKTAIQLLEKIVLNQRQIITDITQKPAEETPQLWALYKEVQDYFDKGMRIPDDITLLFCDDNWGNVRRLPYGLHNRKGGYGMYYHFDYVGGPRNYKWINTNYLYRIWDQMTMSYDHGVNEIWIVNVGDIKPMELPISFFLDLAWNPDSIQYVDINWYFTKWAAQQFGDTYAVKIGNILQKSSKIISLCKPEFLSSKTFSIDKDNEFEQLITVLNKLKNDSESIKTELDPVYYDAYFQLVQHPIFAVENLYRMYYAQALNHQSYYLKSPKTNLYAKQVKEHFITDSLITLQYHTLNHNKWNHMMSQTHIGYTYWQQPLKQILPYTFNLQKWEMIDSIDYKTDKEPKYTYIDLDLEKSLAENNASDKFWKILKNYGRYNNAITTIPNKHSFTLNIEKAPYLNLNYTLQDTSEQLYAHFLYSPTLDIYNNGGFSIAVANNNNEPQIININQSGVDNPNWETWVANNIIHKSYKIENSRVGTNALTMYHMNPYLILQKCYIDNKPSMDSFLGNYNYNY